MPASTFPGSHTASGRAPAPPASGIHTDLSHRDLAVDIEHLTKIYRTPRRRVVAVDNLSMHVPRVGVHGFLGPNGSGKTTTIRMLLGLIHANAGRMRLLDEEVPRHLPSVISQVGAIVESPKYFPAFTGRQNLLLAARTIGAPDSQVDRVLDEVGLRERGGDRFRTYSLGMKQRLAIAGTLLKDPAVLIFDEPTNGLDPAGIQEIRETIRGLGANGHCVLVSSHILSEVQQVADTVSIIGRGRLLAEGSVAELMAGGGSVRVQVPDAVRAAALLRQAGFETQFTGAPPHGAPATAASWDAGSLLVRTAPASDPGASAGLPDAARVNEVLARSGVYASEVVTVQRDLEQVFLELTRGEAPNARAQNTTARPENTGDVR